MPININALAGEITVVPIVHKALLHRKGHFAPVIYGAAPARKLPNPNNLNAHFIIF